MKRLGLFAILTLLAGGSVFAQGGRFDGIAQGPRGGALAGVSVWVCAHGTSYTIGAIPPCTPPSSLFNDQALTQTLPQPILTSSLGNFGFFALPGLYDYFITGATVLPSGPFIASAACLPAGTGCSVNNSLLPTTILSPAASMNFAGTNDITYATTITLNVTATAVTGSPTNGNLMAFHICQDGTGGWTFAWPANFLFTPTIQAGANLCTDTVFKFDGTNWTPLIQPASGGGTSILSSANTFTNTNNFDANVAFKGPNPYYDLSRYGLYTGSGGSITCSAIALSASLSCPGSVGDFAVGQGIEVPLAGAAPAFAPWGVATITTYSRTSNVATFAYTGPTFGNGQVVTIAGLADATFNGSFTVSNNDGNLGHFTVANSGSNLGTTSGSGTATLTSAQVTVTATGILNGSTTYDYKIVLRGYRGELSVASNAGETTIGAATLGINTATVTVCSRASGTATCTTSATHNFQAGAMVDVEGSTNISYNGSHQVVATPGATTFTFLQTSAADDSGTATGGTAKVVAKNIVRWNMQQYANLQSIVYRSKNGGAYSLAGIVEGMDGAFIDWGLGAPSAPAYIPSTPPGSTTNGILAARIITVVGTTLTLDTAATASASSQTAQHDNSPVVLAGCTALGASGTGTLYIPSTNPPAAAMFNSPLDLYHSCNVNQVVISTGSTLSVNEPIIMHHAGTTIQAVSPSSSLARDAGEFTAAVGGSAYPFFYFVPGSFGPNVLKNLNMQPTQPYQSAFVEDGDAGGGNVVASYYINDNIAGGSSTMPGIIRGGFNKFFLNGGSIGKAGSTWGVPESLYLTMPNSLGINPLSTNLPYLLRFERVTFREHGIEWDDWGTGSQAVGGYMTVIDPLMEDGFMPLMTVNNGSAVLTRINIQNAIYADFLGGQSTPFYQVGTSKVYGMVSDFAYCATSQQPLFEGVVTGAEVKNAFAAGCILGSNGVIVTNLSTAGASYRSYQGIPVQVTGTGQFFYPMDTPAPPASAVQSAGGSIPNGVNCYKIVAFDNNGQKTLMSSTATCVTTTGGNGTVTITRPTLPDGAVAWTPYWDLQTAQSTFQQLPLFSVPVGTTTYVHSVNFTSGITAPAVTLAGKANLGAAGVSAGQFTANRIDLIGGAVPSTPSALLGRLFLNSSTNALTCLNSDGSSCLPLGGTVTHTTGVLTNNKLTCGNGADDIKPCDLSGDTSTSGTGVTSTTKVAGNFLIHRALVPAAGNNNGVCSAWYNTVITPTVHAGSNVSECQIPMADGDAVQPPPILLPLDWTGAVDVGVLFSNASTSGTVIFNVATACSPITGTATDDTAFNAVQALGTITLTTPASGQWLATLTNITTTGCTAGQPLQLKITRASDSAAGVANVRAYSITYRTNNTL